MPAPGYHACRLIDPAQCEKGSWRTASAKFGGKPVQILYARIGGKMKRQSVHFPVKHWSAPEARRLCSGKFEPAAARKQEG